MKRSYQWLKRYIDTDLELDEILTVLTDIGLEVDGVERFESEMCIRDRSRSVCVIPSRPIFVRFRMDLSTSSSIIPSAAVTHRCSMASMAERTDVEMPLATLSAQLGLAPSHIMPARLAIMFFTAYDTSSYPPPIR